MKSVLSYLLISVMCLSLYAEEITDKAGTSAPENAGEYANVATIDTGFNVVIGNDIINICRSRNGHVSYFNCIKGNIYVVVDSQASEAGWIDRTFYCVNKATKSSSTVAAIQMPKADNQAARWLIDRSNGAGRKIYTGGLLPSTNWAVLISCFMIEKNAVHFDYLFGNVVYTTVDKGMTVYDRSSKNVRHINIKDPKDNKYIFPYFSADAGRIAYVHSRNFSGANPSTDIMIYDLSIQKYIKRIQTFDVLQVQLSSDKKVAIVVYCRHMASRSTATVKDYIWRTDIYDLNNGKAIKTISGMNACWIK